MAGAFESPHFRQHFPPFRRKQPLTSGYYCNLPACHVTLNDFDELLAHWQSFHTDEAPSLDSDMRISSCFRCNQLCERDAELTLSTCQQCRIDLDAAYVSRFKEANPSISVTTELRLQFELPQRTAEYKAYILICRLFSLRCRREGPSPLFTTTTDQFIDSIRQQPYGVIISDQTRHALRQHDRWLAFQHYKISKKVSNPRSTSTSSTPSQPVRLDPVTLPLEDTALQHQRRPLKEDFVCDFSEECIKKGYRYTTFQAMLSHCVNKHENFVPDPERTASRITQCNSCGGYCQRQSLQIAYICDLCARTPRRQAEVHRTSSMSSVDGEHPPRAKPTFWSPTLKSSAIVASTSPASSQSLAARDNLQEDVATQDDSTAVTTTLPTPTASISATTSKIPSSPQSSAKSSPIRSAQKPRSTSVSHRQQSDDSYSPSSSGDDEDSDWENFKDASKSRAKPSKTRCKPASDPASFQRPPDPPPDFSPSSTSARSATTSSTGNVSGAQQSRSTNPGTTSPQQQAKRPRLDNSSASSTAAATSTLKHKTPAKRKTRTSGPDDPEQESFQHIDDDFEVSDFDDNSDVRILYTAGLPQAKSADQDDDSDDASDDEDGDGFSTTMHGTFVCPKCSDMSFPTDFQLLQHLLQRHTRFGYVHDIGQDDITKAGLNMCDICLTVSLKKNQHPCRCYKLGAVEDDFSKTRKVFSKCLATSVLANFNFGLVQALDQYDWPTICSRQFKIVPPLKRSETFGYAFEYISSVILDQVVKPLDGSNAEQQNRIYMLLMLLPRVLLSYPANYNPREQSLNNVLLNRINDFLNLQFDKLFQEAADNCQEYINKQAAYAQQPQVDGNSSSPAHVSRDALVKKHAKINYEVSHGNISKASTLLSSESQFMNPSDPDVKQQLQDLFRSDPALPLAESTLPAPLTKYITPKDVESALNTSKKSAAGPSGWSFDLLKMVARRKTGQVLLAAFLNRLLQGGFPEEMTHALSVGALTVLSKPNGNGVRPIVVSDVFVRLLSKTIVIREQRHLGQRLAPIQAGVGLSGGIEFVIHTVRHLLHSHDDQWACISIDCRNAYGSILLKAIQDELKSIKHGRADLISAYFDRFVACRRLLKTGCNSNSYDDAVEVGDGIIQGDPLSPLLFCLAIQPVLQRVQRVLQSGFVFGYLDDVVIVGPIAEIFPAFDLFKTCAADIGLQVNLTKTKVLTLHTQQLSTSSAAASATSAAPAHPDDDANMSATSDTGAQADASTLSLLSQSCANHLLPPPTNCILLLGTPVGEPAQESKEAIKFVNAIAFNKSKELPNHQVRFALLHDTFSHTVTHLARTVPPSCAKPAFSIFDGKILDVVRACLEARPEEISAMTRKEIALPRNNGGFGLPELKDSCELAYFASVFGVIQTWLLYKKADDPFLQSWIADTDDFVDPIPQKLSKFKLVREIRHCLNKAHHIATEAVRAKNSKPAATATNTASDDPKSKVKAKPSKSRAPPNSEVTSTPTVVANAFALSILPANLQGMLTLQKKHAIHTILLKCKAAVDTHDFYTNWLTTNEERAQFNSKRGVGAAAFLRALPSETGLTFENKYFMIALRLYLRLPVIPKFGISAGVPCVCGRETKSGQARLTEDHLLNCQAFSVMNNRHEALKNVFVDLLRHCKLTPDFEDLAGPGTGRINRWDISADRYNQENQDLKVDITVVNPATRHMAPKSAKQQGAAARKARAKKRSKYKEFLKPSDDFIPLVFESFGLIDTPVLALICSLAKRVNNVAPDSATWTAPTFKSYAVQRLSTCLWRENAIAVEKVITNTATEHQYEHYNAKEYEDRVVPQFEMSSADFPPLIASEKKKVTIVTLVEKPAKTAKIGGATTTSTTTAATTSATTTATTAATTTSIAPVVHVQDDGDDFNTSALMTLALGDADDANDDDLTVTATTATEE